MAVLVTGGAGYIGSIMTEVLVRGGFRCIVADDLSCGHAEAVAPEAALIVGDVTKPEFLDEVFAAHSIEAVLHFAAYSLVGESMRDPTRYFRNNVGGVMAILDRMVRHGIRRFILSSTAATYGDPQTTPIPEDAPTAPTNPYGQSKLICEQILSWYGRIHGVQWTSLRYFNAAGASAERGEDHAVETHLIPLALRATAGLGPELEIFGLDYPTPDGTCVRDYIHVEDLAQAHLQALQGFDLGHQGIYNLGNGQGFSVLEVLQAVERVTGRKVPRRNGPRRPGDPARLVASSGKALHELTWKPRHDRLETIVETAWNWQEAHPGGYGGRGSGS
jgi:UDP-glucose 4-epimerase